MKITAVGDCAIQKNLPKYYDGFDKIKKYINRGDVRFFNLETTVCENCYPAKHSGGTWLRTDKSKLWDMHEFGFNVTTPANNHCMDFSMNGFLQTIDNIKDAGFLSSGGGRNLAEATRPAYIDTPNGRAAVISCTTDYSPGAEAGEQSRDFSGRPGINPLTVSKVVYVGKDDIEKLFEIAEKTHLNAYSKIMQKEGYAAAPKENELDFDGTKFRIGNPETKFEISENDIDRIKTAIKDASFQADIILVSVHSHKIEGDSKEYVSEFLKEFAHICIDAGAHAVIGHGPHLLRPFEIYNGLPIFYSLGDFILHLENCEILPYDYYKKYGCKPQDGIYEVFKNRTKDFTVGLQRQREMTEAVISYFEIESGQLKCLEFMPVELGFGMPHSQFGWPREAKDNLILQRLSEMSSIQIDESGRVKV
ncbi:MAG: CapA family protein [Firmicutes bacterium]|nr:CapA family protein [Bacillota bacterium]